MGLDSETARLPGTTTFLARSTASTTVDPFSPEVASMNTSCALRVSPAPFRTWIILIVMATAWSWAGDIWGTDLVRIVRVEEDWELVVTTPETANNSPQVTCAMSPTSSLDGAYFTVELNHQSQPGYATGGMHVHAWDGAYLHGSVHMQPGVGLNEADETLTWTQRLSLESGTLTCDVVDGSSTTWGVFGTGELQMQVPSSLTDLNGYSYNTTLAGSGVGFGSNRVASLTLKRVRLYTAEELVVVIELNHDALAQSSSP
jgi:hypothetical protein